MAIRGALAKLAKNVSSFSPDSAASIDNFVSAIDAYFDGSLLGNLKRFAPLFGRGQQYLSFIRR